MKDEHELTVVPEEAADVPEETPERPTPFVYPREFTTERGEVLDLPWPGSLIEVRIAKKIGEILKLAPQLRGLFGSLDSATAEGVDPEVASGELLSDLGDVMAQAVAEVPEMVIEIMEILTGLDKDDVGTRLSIMGDGIKLIGNFITKELSRLGQAGFNLNADLGFKTPTLADVAAQAADRGVTGEAPNG